MKAIVALSGGMDSATVLAECHLNGRDIQAVGFFYNSKHNQWENIAAVKVAKHYNVPFSMIDISGVMRYFKSDLLLSGNDIPEGHYEEESMKRTIVPARNIIFASILAGLAVSEKAEEIWLGVHAGDHHIYPDCRPAFIGAMNRAIQLGTDTSIQLKTPFIAENKIGILQFGLQYDVPYHLTRTCYSAGEIACGRCGSCQERLAAWQAVNRNDPIPYLSCEIFPKE